MIGFGFLGGSLFSFLSLLLLLLFFLVLYIEVGKRLSEKREEKKEQRIGDTYGGIIFSLSISFLFFLLRFVF